MHSRLRITEFLLLLSLATLPLSNAQQVSVKVVSKTDGDTIEVLIDGKAEQVRLYGIDALVKSQAYGSKAKPFRSLAAFGKTVTVNLKDNDPRGRLVGEVILPNGGNLNLQLVHVGPPWWYRQYAPKDKELQRLQREASVARRTMVRH